MSHFTDYFKDLSCMQCYFWSLRSYQIIILDYPSLGIVFTHGICVCRQVVCWWHAEKESCPGCISETVSVHTHVCGLRHPTADLRRRIFQTFSFMFHCSHVSESNLRHQTSDLRQRFFRSGTEKIGSQVNLHVCLQNIEKVRKKFAVANRPLGVVSHIHVYMH